MCYIINSSFAHENRTKFIENNFINIGGTEFKVNKRKH